MEGSDLYLALAELLELDLAHNSRTPLAKWFIGVKMS